MDDPLPLADQIASCALQHYTADLVGNKGKPKQNEEWTVYAAIVAVHHNGDDGRKLWVVSSSTGTKCTAYRQKGCVLHDSHAEVLARRGLMRVLWREIAVKEQGMSEQTRMPNRHPSLLVPSSESSLVTIEKDRKQLHEDRKPSLQRYTMNPEIQLHLYISDSPCGDASIYGVSVYDDLLFTGAKVVISNATGVTAIDCGGNHQLLLSSQPRGDSRQNNNYNQNATANAVVAREEKQVLGKLRTKSGRSNLPNHLRSTSMSCSDKLVLWCLLGLQGGLLTKVLNPPLVPLTSLVVSRDPRILDSSPQVQQSQLEALERAIPSRVEQALQILKSDGRNNTQTFLSWKPQIPTVHVVSNIFSFGKAAVACEAIPNNRNNEKQSSPIVLGRKRKRMDSNSDDQDNNLINDETNNRKKVSPCGIALNWNNSDQKMELVVGARGIQQGKKPKSLKDYQKLASRLCRASLVVEIPFDRIFGVQNFHNKRTIETSATTTYQHLKHAFTCTVWSEVKTRLLTREGSPLAGWLRSSDGGDDSDFVVMTHAKLL